MIALHNNNYAARVKNRFVGNVFVPHVESYCVILHVWVF